MIWHLSHRFDPRALPLADRHYNRQKIGSPQFVPPGRCVVLLSREATALWVTSWPFGEFVRHAWPGAWINSLFRREAGEPASEMILDAVAATRAIRAPPPMGLVTFVNAAKVEHKHQPGRCYLKAGFAQVGETKGGLLAFQLLPEQMPAPLAALPAEVAQQRLAL